MDKDNLKKMMKVQYPTLHDYFIDTIIDAYLKCPESLTKLMKEDQKKEKQGVKPEVKEIQTNYYNVEVINPE